MSYIINKTDGSDPIELIDGTIDQVSTDLTLIGKNASSYGEFINENFIRLLENFSNTTSPNYPINGQLWYDTSESRLKIYDSGSWKVAGGTVVAPSRPTNLTTGDIWLDSKNQQLHFNAGLGTVLLGPLYTQSQGLSGFYIENVLDSNNIEHTVAKLYVAQELIGIFSKESFTPAQSITNFDGNIINGFKSTNYTNNGIPIIFDIIASKSTSLVSIDGETTTEVSVADFLLKEEDSIVTGQLSLTNFRPLVLGPASNVRFEFGNDNFSIISIENGQNIVLTTTNDAQTRKDAIFISASDERVGIFTSTPSSTLDVNGNATIQNDFLVSGKNNLPLGLSAITTGMSNSQIASNLIIKVYPPSEHLQNTICRIICNDNVQNTVKVYKLIDNIWVWQEDLA